MRNTSRAKVSGWLAMALPALLPVAAFAEPLVLEAQPTPEPIVAAPAAQPEVVAPTPAPIAPAPIPVAAQNPLPDTKLVTGKILVLPFQAVNPNDPSPWLGKSIQQSMAADLTVAAPDHVLMADQPAPSLDAAVAVGKQNSARYVIAGGFITVDHELRITGQVVDVETGKPVAGLKATGDPSQIFRMEDALALQVRGQVLGQKITPMEFGSGEQQNTNAAAPAAPPAAATGITIPDAAPQTYSPYATAPAPVVYNSTAATYYPSYPTYYDTTYVSGYDPYYYPATYAYAPYYPLYCDYGYYGGCYPFGLGIGFFFGNGFHHHFDFDRGHGFHGGGHFDGHHDGIRGGIVGGGRTSLGIGGGLSFNAGVRTNNFRGSLSVSPGITRSASRITSSAAPFRSSAFYAGSSFGRSSTIGGFHAGGSFSHASIGGGGFSHGGSAGIGHGGGGGGHGGGHR